MALVRPHGGGNLEPLMLTGKALADELQRARTLPKIKVSSREKGDLVMMGIGGFTPLEGFMSLSDWQGVCAGMKMANGVFWPIPITLSTDFLTANDIETGREIALIDPEDDSILATMRVTEKYTIDKAHECATVFNTVDIEHPGVKMVMAQGDVNLAGPVKVLSLGGFDQKYGELFMTPRQTRELFEEMGWSKIAAFQTRNPMHRAHEELCKMAKDAVNADGILVHMLLGKLKKGDIPAEVRDAAIRKMVELYFPPNTVMVTGYGFDMLYAGPREAVLHAVFRQNAGCTHLIVGRDHAGVGNYYGPFDAQEIFHTLQPDALAIEIFNADHTAYSRKLNKVVMMRDVPDHNPEDFVLLSGTKVRDMLAAGQPLPVEFARPEVAEILMRYYQGEATATSG